MEGRSLNHSTEVPDKLIRQVFAPVLVAQPDLPSTTNRLDPSGDPAVAEAAAFGAEAPETGAPA